jgi:hypothetical protein
MPDPFLDPILRRIDRAERTSRIRTGLVTAIDGDDVSMTVDCSGDILTGVRWYTHYSPTVADVVDVLNIHNQWVVLGARDVAWTAPPTSYDGTVDIGGTLYYGVETESTGAWVWTVYNSARQGRYTDKYVDFTFGTVGAFPNPTTVLPAGATITTARLVLTRSTAQITPTGLITPRFWQHTYTSAPVGAPTYTGTVWSPGTIALGESVSWEIPSGWLAAWLAGTIRGFGCYSDALADHAAFTQLTTRLTYTAPIL